jgi:hypothetical protein
MATLAEFSQVMTNNHSTTLEGEERKKREGDSQNKSRLEKQVKKYFII